MGRTSWATDDMGRMHNSRKEGLSFLGRQIPETKHWVAPGEKKPAAGAPARLRGIRSPVHPWSTSPGSEAVMAVGPISQGPCTEMPAAGNMMMTGICVSSFSFQCRQKTL